MAAMSVADMKEVDVIFTEDELREELRLAIENDETLRDDATELLREVRALISTLDAHHRNVNIARITGSSVSIVGGSKSLA
nr:hypothetical protein BaRGS_029151 [Batillaria attramentaria]